MGELVHSDLENNHRASLQKKNIIKIFTVGSGTFRRIYYILEAHCDTQSLDVSTALPAQVLWAALPK